MAKRYTVTDGKMVLELLTAREGGYTVTAPMIPGLVTEAESVEEAFLMARDAMKSLTKARAKLEAQAKPTRRRSA